jgi:N-acetylglucosamine kinase-like BadF-type ATPase
MPKKTKKDASPLSYPNLYLGVDGGGTKTHIVLMNEEKRIICEGFAGASNPLRVGVENAVGNIIKAIDSACDVGFRSRDDIVSATLGLAGVRRADIRRIVLDSFKKRLSIKKIQIFTDAEIALYGTTLGKLGLVVIAGTGSICIGQDGNGKKATAGGWGPLAGDEGGGAGIAKRALQAIAKASDGRSKPTELSRVASEYFRTAKTEDLIVAIYSPQTDNAKIAGFARDVVETAKEGDEVAREILREGGFELGLAANAVIKQLHLENKKVPIGCVGSIFKAGEMLTCPMLETIHKIAPKAFLTTPQLFPAQAAAQMAYENFRNNSKHQTANAE